MYVYIYAFISDPTNPVMYMRLCMYTLTRLSGVKVQLEQVWDKAR